MNGLAIPSNARGAALLGVAWTCAGLAVAVVVTRFYVRLRIIDNLRVNDWLILLTLGMALVLSSFCSVSVHWGLGQHIQYLTPKQATNAIKWIYITEFFAIMTPNFGRISFALLLLDLIPPQPWRRNLLWTLIILQFVVDVATVIVTYAQCTPVRGFWDHSLRAKCWASYIQANTGYFQGSFCALIDLTLAVFPASLFWNLQMKLSTRVSLSILMGLGIFSMAASIAKTVELRNVDETKDLTYGMADLAICFTLEAYTVLIAGSIPTLRPLAHHGRNGTSRRGSGEKQRRWASYLRRDRSVQQNDDAQGHGPFVPMQNFQRTKAFHGSSSAEDEESIQESNIRMHTHIDVSWERKESP